MTRSKFLISIALFTGATVACEKDRSLLRPPLVPSPQSKLGVVMGYVTEPGAVVVGGVQIVVADGPFKGRSAMTDSTGLYELRDVDGEFTLTFQKSGYATTTLRVTVGVIQLNAEIVPLTPQPDVSGNWRARFEPSTKCGQTAGAEAIAAIDFVEYGASVGQRGARLEIMVSGGGLVTPAHFGGTIQGTAVSMTIPPPCDYYCTASMPPPLILSKLPNGHYFMLGGNVSATLKQNSLAGTLSGMFALTSNAPPPYDFIGACQDAEHRVTFSR